MSTSRGLAWVWGAVLAAGAVLAVAALVDGDLLGVVVGAVVAAWAYTSLRARRRDEPQPPAGDVRPATRRSGRRRDRA